MNIRLYVQVGTRPVRLVSDIEFMRGPRFCQKGSNSDDNVAFFHFS